MKQKLSACGGEKVWPSAALTRNLRPPCNSLPRLATGVILSWGFFFFYALVSWNVATFTEEGDLVCCGSDQAEVNKYTHTHSNSPTLAHMLTHVVDIIELFFTFYIKAVEVSRNKRRGASVRSPKLARCLSLASFQGTESPQVVRWKQVVVSRRDDTVFDTGENSPSLLCLEKASVDFISTSRVSLHFPVFVGTMEVHLFPTCGHITLPEVKNPYCTLPQLFDSYWSFL